MEDYKQNYMIAQKIFRHYKLKTLKKKSGKIAFFQLSPAKRKGMMGQKFKFVLVSFLRFYLISSLFCGLKKLLTLFVLPVAAWSEANKLSFLSVKLYKRTKIKYMFWEMEGRRGKVSNKIFSINKKLYEKDNN